MWKLLKRERKKSMSKFLKYYNTLKYLKPTQIEYRLYYLLRNKYRKITNFSYPLSLPRESADIKLKPSIPSLQSFRKEGKRKCFEFLNLKECFEKIDWNFEKFGKLWAYNLNYFNYLEQKEMDKEEGIKLIKEFIENIKENEEGLEPYPISLRGINWIKFLSKHSIKDKTVINSLYAQYKILADNLEYHVLGNHILENGFSLLFGGYYFNDEELYEKGKEIIKAELEEEILPDGAHFELSPMYHQLILFRTLDSLNLVQNNDLFGKELEEILQDKASLMLGWLNRITFRNGNIPLFNDSTNKIAPTTKELNEYAESLGVKERKTSLKESGYRKFENDLYELIADVGNIGPDYIPGHAHSDTFNFELYVNEKPFIVDTGVSTYENNERRFIERSTYSHNTVKIGNYEQSEVWSSFRVANRAKIVSLKESENEVEATHNGYEKIGFLHTRAFRAEKNEIVMEDKISKIEGEKDKDIEKTAFLHFHPSVSVTVLNDTVKTNMGEIKIKGAEKIEIDDFYYAPEYNRLKRSKMVKIKFKDNCKYIFTFVTKS